MNKIKEFIEFQKFLFADNIVASFFIIIFSLWKILESIGKMLWYLPRVLIDILVRVALSFKKRSSERMEGNLNGNEKENRQTRGQTKETSYNRG